MCCVMTSEEADKLSEEARAILRGPEGLPGPRVCAESIVRRWRSG